VINAGSSTNFIMLIYEDTLYLMTFYRVIYVITCYLSREREADMQADGQILT